MNPPDTQTKRIALLIDADNAPAALIDEILTELSKFGVINIRRAYGNWTKQTLAGWRSRLLDFAIQPMQQFDYSKHKNASDMAMTVDAMDLLYTERPDAFGVVSSDADFTPLVMHLRAKGAAVYGFGAAKTPQPFVNACSRFLYLEALAESSVELEPGAGALPNGKPTEPPAGRAGTPGAESAPAADERAYSAATANANEVAAAPVPKAAAPHVRLTTAQLRRNASLMALLRDAVKSARDESNWATVGAVGTHISNKASFDPRNYGYATLSKLMRATEDFDWRDEGTSRVSVSVKQQKPARKKANPTTKAKDEADSR